MSATATFYPVVGGNDTAWRCEWPAEAVGGVVARIPQPDAEKALTAPNRDTALPWALLAREPGKRLRRLDTAAKWARFNSSPRTLESLACDFPAHQGAAVFPRPCIARATLAKAMRSNGVRTIAETDDNYFTNPRLNIAARQQTQQNYLREVHALGMVSMGVNIFSTAWLRDRYWAEYLRRFGNLGLPEMHVCRNHIPRDKWPTAAEYDGPVRVGFMGSPSHLWDVHLAYAAFHAAKHVGARTVMVGYNPANPDPDMPDEVPLEDGTLVRTRTDKSLRVSARWAKVIDEHVRWVDPSAYHRAPLPLDIGLAPLRLNDFTRGRSDSKAIEFVVSGAVPVLQRHPVYTSAGWKHGVNALLAKSQEEMGVQTLRLIRDPKMRRELLANAQEFVRTARNETHLAAEWGAALGI